MEDSTAITESSLLSKLESSTDLSSTHRLFSSFLNPFAAVLNKPKKQSKSSKTDAETSTLIRSLAKKFLPFLNKSLSLLPKRLSQTPKIDAGYAPELFDTYKLCLSCVDSISSQLDCKPYSVQIQRARLIHCYENWGRYEDAQIEGFSVLESIGKMFPGKRGGKLKGRIVPELGKENGCDQDVALLIVEVVVTLVKCLVLDRSKEAEDYRRVLTMVDEIRPWFRVIDANACEKMRRLLVTYLSKCTLFIVGEGANFDGNLSYEFCSVTFSEFANSSMKDQMEKFACRLCSNLFSQLENQLLCSADILICVLDSMAGECKIGKEKAILEFLELVGYCAIKCRNATDFCGAVATHFHKLAGDFSQVNLSAVALITRLYAIGLSVCDSNGYSKGGGSTMPKAGKDISIVRVLLNKDDQLQGLTTFLRPLIQRYNMSAEEIGLPFGAECESLGTKRHLLMEVNDDASLNAQDRKTYMPFYFSALKFLFEPLSELINSGRKEILAGDEVVSFPIKLLNIQDSLHQFCLVFLTYSASERENDINDDNNRAVLAAAVAAFTLSFATKKNIKESTNILRHLISADWLQTNGLKYLFASLNNVGIALYRSSRLKEATKSLKLCCKAACRCVLHFCKMFAVNRDGFSADLPEDTITNSVSEACARSAFLLDVLYQCGSRKVDKILKDCLESWSVAKSLFDKIPSPRPLVKQWVRIEYELSKDVEVESRAPTLYYLMSSSTTMSKRALGILLEQKLQVYKEMKSVNPELCKRMQVAITNILLKEIYITKDFCLQKSRILIMKGRESRACGVEGLNDCIKYISEAISTMDDLNDESKHCCIQIRHQLAEAYCLRALSTQEAEPSSKHFIQDIGNALELWLSPEHSQSSDQTHMVTQKTLTLLYYVADMLSVKGYMKYHSDIYEMMIRLFMWNNVPLEKCLAMLWQSRRLSHALCVSPVIDAFIMTLSKHCNMSNSMEFWISCMERSQSLKVGFLQNLLIQSQLTLDEVKQAASDLITSVPLSSSSVFLAACLYYDLGERLIAKGLMIEALFYANEAHRLRSKLFQEKFMYTIEKKEEAVDANGDVIQKSEYVLKTFHMHPSVATAAWSNDKASSDFEEFILTPWGVLQCYLASTLQMGIIHEAVGNGSEAETLLRWGKTISCFQGLSIFLVSFSSTLGKVYRKQRLWHVAEKELENAKRILANSCSLISCSKCKMVLEVTVNQQLGDLYRSRFSSTVSNESYEGLSEAEKFYRSAIENLNLSEWKNCVSNPEKSNARGAMFCDALLKVGNTTSISTSHSAANHGELNFPSEIGGRETSEPKITRKGKKSTKPLRQEKLTTYRLTRSKFQSFEKRSEYIQNEVQNGFTKYSERKYIYTCPDALSWKGLQSNVDHVVACECEVSCVFDKANCWHCLPSEITKSASLKSYIQMKWEYARRRLLLQILTGIGKCFGVRGEIHKAHEVLLESISVLVSRSTFHQTYFSIPFTFFVELIEKNVTGDVFAVEHASLVYNLCLFSLKSSHGRGTRGVCCDLAPIPIPDVVAGLKSSFILCREVPLLFQKVSLLLAVLYTLSTSNEAFSMPSSSGSALSESQWASYFHQASLGTHLNHQLFSRIGRKNVQTTMDVEGSCLSSSTSLSSLRITPSLVQDLEGFILKFYKGLPSATIVCISMLGDAFTSLLREVLLLNPPTHAWIMVSRLNSDSLPVVVLLPIDSVLEEGSEDVDDDDPSSGFLFNRKCSIKQWHCPWGSTIIDDVAPLFKLILEENYISSSAFPLENTKMNRSLWWTRRRKLDQCLADFLKDLEDLWFGPWKFLLLGDWSDCKHLDSLQKKLMDDLTECKVNVHESIIKVIVGGAEHAFQREKCFSELILKKGCFVGGGGCHNDGSKQEEGSLSSSVCNLISEAIHDIEEEDFVSREPVILVLDFDVQMLPWESLPVLRNQEVYRMPSIASISSTFKRCCQNQEEVAKDSVVFPMIDPLDAYYLLNPSGDLSSTEAEFENWFRDQNLEGMTGTSPTVDELSVALKNHDLFIYFGHGSGAQYIPGDEIKKLDRCAATLLMGCSSGSLSLNGSYSPKGVPLCYLLAGSPVVVANLWEVTDKDIDRFGKAMLDGWIRERSSASIGCAQCNEITDKFKSMNIDEGKRKGKKKRSRKKSLEACEVDDCTICCKHRPKIGSFMGQAREACTLPFLIGASPVCYGVPTFIRKK